VYGKLGETQGAL